MIQTEMLLCANCSRPVRKSEANDAGWRYFSDGAGELHPFCGLCARREFHPDARAGFPDAHL